jgi:type II secretory pathway component PulF
MAIIIVVVITQTAMPKIMYIYGKASADMPLITQIVMRLGEFINAYVILIVAVLAIIVILSRALRGNPVFKKLHDFMLLSMPYVGKIIYFDFVSRFARNLGHLLRYNVPLDAAVVLARSTLWHTYSRRVANEIEDRVRKGVTFSEALEKGGYFPETMVWMLRFAEQRGDLEKALNDVADYYDDRYFELRGEVTQYFEPFLILFIGAVIGLLVIAFYLPLFYLPQLVFGF